MAITEALKYLFLAAINPIKAVQKVGESNTLISTRRWLFWIGLLILYIEISVLYFVYIQSAAEVTYYEIFKVCFIKLLGIGIAILLLLITTITLGDKNLKPELHSVSIGLSFAPEYLFFIFCFIAPSLFPYWRYLFGIWRMVIIAVAIHQVSELSMTKAGISSVIVYLPMLYFNYNYFD